MSAELRDYLERTGAKPFKALDVQLQLINWAGGSRALDMYRRIEEIALTTGERLVADELDPGGEFDRVRYIVSRLHDGLNRAQTIWVEPDKCALVEYATRTLPSDDIIHASDMFVPAGFAYFARPMLIDTYTDGSPLTVRALAWFPQLVRTKHGARDGVHMYLWSDVENRGNPYDVPGGVLPTDATAWAFETPVEDAIGRRQMITYDEDTNEELTVADESYVGDRRLLVALNRLLWQKVTVGTRLPAPRALERRVARMKRPAEYGYVWVAHLRRLQRPRVDGDETMDLEGRYTCRWRVHGFWRDQHYPSLGPAYLEDGRRNPDSHRVIWIDDFIKGPDWAPLRVGDRVFSLDR